MSLSATGHADLMDSVYRWQRHIYDVTRKYYLLGRNRMIGELGIPGSGLGTAVLEIGCGTGRNLVQISRHWPSAALYGIDISSEMLQSASARLGSQAQLAIGDAAGFDARALFGRLGFDRVIFAYCTSMIPEWRQAVAHACGLVAPGGSVHIVDFGDMAGLPRPIRRMLLWWLARFHVTPRPDLAAAARDLAAAHGLRCEAVTAGGGYFQLVRLTRPA